MFTPRPLMKAKKQYATRAATRDTIVELGNIFTKLRTFFLFLSVIVAQYHEEFHVEKMDTNTIDVKKKKVKSLAPGEVRATLRRTGVSDCEGSESTCGVWERHAQRARAAMIRGAKYGVLVNSTPVRHCPLLMSLLIGSTKNCGVHIIWNI